MKNHAQRRHASLLVGSLVIAFLWLSTAPALRAQVTSSWNTGSGTFNITNAANWSPSGTPSDTLLFTNSSPGPFCCAPLTINWMSDLLSTNVIFNQVNNGRVVYLQISNNTWTIVNNLLVAPGPNTTIPIVLQSGSIVVTNSDGTGLATIGVNQQTYGGDGGEFIMQSNAALIVDNLIVTNGDYALNIQDGSVTVNHTSLLDELELGSAATAALPATFNMLAGTTNTLVNHAYYSGGVNQSVYTQPFYLYNYATWNVTGPGTILTNRNTSGPGAQDYFINVGGAGYNNDVFNLSNGVTAYTSIKLGGTNNTVWVNGSTLYAASVLPNGTDNNQFVITNGGVVNVSGGGGALNFAGSSNTVLVTGSGSALNANGYINMNSSVSAGDVLKIAQGGTVTAPSISMGGNNPSAEGAVIVTDSGSLLNLTNGGLTMGNYYDNGGGVLAISNGAHALMTGGITMGFGYIDPSNNLVVVDGNGSLLVAPGTLTVGSSSSGNRFFVTSGGKAYTGAATVGAGANSSGSSFTLTGSGSVWTNAGFTLGYVNSSNNTLTVSGGAQLQSTYMTTYGVGNTLSVIGGSTWTNANGDIDLDGGYNGNNNLIVVSNNSAAVVLGAHNLLINAGIGDSAEVYVDSSALSVGNAITEGSTGQGILVATNGSTVKAASITVGNAWSSTGSVFTVDGSYVTNSGAFVAGGTGVGAQVTVANHSVLTNSTGLTVGNYGNSTLMTISGGSQVAAGSGGLIIGANSFGGNGGNSNTLVVTDPGTVLSGSGAITLGQYVSYGGDSLIVSNGALVQFTGALVTGPSGNYSNQVVVTGPNSTLIAPGNTEIGSSAGNQDNLLMISDGAKFYGGEAYFGYQYAGTNNSIVVTGPGSLYTNTGLYMAYAGSGARVTVSDGAQMVSAGGSTLIGLAASSNSITVTDPGSVWSNYNDVQISQGAGPNDHDNQLIVSNGAQVIVNASLGTLNNLVIGQNTASTNSTVAVTGPGSFLQVLGTNATSGGIKTLGVNGQLQVNDGGMVEANTLDFSAPGASATNNGGTYQFRTGSPTITTNNGYDGSIVLNGGAISFRGVSNANVYAGLAGSGNPLSRITYLGDNTLRLDNSSNTANVVSYTFDTGVGQGTNFAALELINGTTRWQSTNVNIGSHGSMLVSNTTASIRGVVTNTGRIQVTDSTATFENSVFNGLTVKGIEVDNSTVTIQGDLGNEGNLTLNNSADVVQGNMDNENSVAVSGGSLAVQGALTNNANMTVTGASWTNQGSVNNQGSITVVGNAVIQGTVTNANGATLSVTGGSLKVQGNDVNNQGSIQVNNSAALFLSPLTVGGSYISDPSTNTFSSNVTVSASGFITGTSGDVFNFQQSLFIHSTNNTAFDLSTSTVEFSGGGVHTNAITGQDVGANAFGLNFEYGRLTLASTNDLLQFTQGGTSVSNALYVQTLDLSAFVGDYTSVSNMVASLLYAPSSINVYYLAALGGNAYLSSLRYPLESFPGGGPGGFLIPAIPEPSTMLLWVMGAGCIAWLRRRRS